MSTNNNCSYFPNESWFFFLLPANTPLICYIHSHSAFLQWPIITRISSLSVTPHLLWEWIPPFCPFSFWLTSPWTIAQPLSLAPLLPLCRWHHNTLWTKRSSSPVVYHQQGSQSRRTRAQTVSGGEESMVIPQFIYSLNPVSCTPL